MSKPQLDERSEMAGEFAREGGYSALVVEAARRLAVTRPELSCEECVKAALKEIRGKYAPDKRYE